jgi:hypothetical protein
MILVDANLLIYAVMPDAPQHAAAKSWLEERFNEPPRVALPWPVVLAFLRIVTNPRVFSRPAPISAAWSRVSEWLALPQVWVPQAGEEHAAVLGDLLTQIPGGDLVPDAHLAALAIEHGLTLCSTDGDFARFPRLRWENPLKGI